MIRRILDKKKNGLEKVQFKAQGFGKSGKKKKKKEEIFSFLLNVINILGRVFISLKQEEVNQVMNKDGLRIKNYGQKDIYGPDKLIPYLGEHFFL